MVAFPNQQPVIPKITSPTTQYMDDVGVQAYALHNQIAGEVEAIAASIGTTGSTVAGTVEKRLTDTIANLSSHTGNTSNPHSTTKTQVGLGNCDNTSDSNKPVSTAQAAAIAAAQAAAIAAASAAAPVQSVAGKTGAVTLATSDVSGFTAAASAAAPVQSVAGKTGAVTLATSDVSGFTAAASAAAPVQSVAGRTGNVTLAVADVSGAAPAASPALTGVPTAPTASPGTNTTQVATTAFAGNAASTAQSAAIAACPAETASSIGSLIAGAAEKTVIAPTDKISLSDAAASNILKYATTADLLQALYLLGVPRTAFQTAIPFVLLPGDGGANGLTFTGSGGAFTLSAAPLAGLFSGLSGQWCYGYLPANAGNSGCSAGWYGFIPSSDTAGTFYNDQYTGGQPQIVGSPTTFAGVPSGRITQTTSEIVALSGINLLAVGANGSIMLFPRFNGDSSATKTFRFRANGTVIAADTPSTSPNVERGFVVRNRGSTGKQTSSRQLAGIGQASASITGDFASADLSGTPALTVSMQLSANTGCAVLLGLDVDQRYGA